ncbi:hypothetical protein [Actinophytocola sp.]|uniref:hypothetical protein n=1 Tax=Actinophytocola sp. TaxID=1872138 RepID=UPI00389AF504
MAVLFLIFWNRFSPPLDFTHSSVWSSAANTGLLPLVVPAELAIGSILPLAQAHERVERLDTGVLVEQRALAEHLQQRVPRVLRLVLGHRHDLYDRCPHQRPRLADRLAVRVPPVRHDRCQSLDRHHRSEQRRLTPTTRPRDHPAPNAGASP